MNSQVKKVCETPSFFRPGLASCVVNPDLHDPLTDLLSPDLLPSFTLQYTNPATANREMDSHAALDDFDFDLYAATEHALTSPLPLSVIDAQHLADTILRCLQSRVLMVGAGGIGCELLKNLVLLGFSEIHVVDLDTIDLSNLNRQFLFRHEHIKKSKALVAKETAQKFNPRVKIEAHHANIKESHFNVEWFKGFNIVLNALDNMDARRHVNKMCLAADVPLVESGTTGFNGQVQVIKKGVTACYDCTPKDAPKSFPVCTIRSTPSQPIHCIVWGKSYLLKYDVPCPPPHIRHLTFGLQ